jgi:hypothetical protein
LWHCVFLYRTNQLTLWSWALLERSPAVKLLDGFPAFYGTQSLTTAFTRALHLSLSRDRQTRSTPPQPISLRSIVILSTHLHLGFSGCLFPSCCPTNNLYEFLFSSIHATCPTNLIFLHLIVLILLSKEYKLWSSLLCRFLHFTSLFSLCSK